MPDKTFSDVYLSAEQVTEAHRTLENDHTVSEVELLRIISDAGTTLVEAVSDTTVAAGASADASWFPHIASTAPVAPAGTTVSWIHLHDINITVPSGAGHTIYDFTASTVYTNDTSTFTVVAGNGVTINAVGYYVAVISCDWNGAAGAFSCEMVWNLEALDNGMFDQDVFNKPGFAGGVAVTQASQGFPIDPSSVGTSSPLSLKQTTGFNAGVAMEATIVRLTDDYGNF
jgi:hypothetical protein